MIKNQARPRWIAFVAVTAVLSGVPPWSAQTATDQTAGMGAASADLAPAAIRPRPR
jgi:hypothetical protein